MTTADQPRPRSTWLAHHYAHLGAVYLAALTASYVWPDNLALLTARTVSLAALVAALVGLNRHEAILCPRCAAEFPIDGAEQAQRRMWCLRYVHRYKLKALVVVTAALLLTIWWEWFNSAVWAVLLVDHCISTVHRRLELWCPWCRRGRGDDDVQIVPPVPTGSGSKS